ncbi:DUF309 domain-containing protein [Xylanibacillus composti]|uniref:DUF309 domain-containing protein n=1 Tax=Xylanibacillus composti TaxID=1572762 RepID=A0A8J4GZS7_9BACL|nr:DUF309 domain-containing protein [Xylanibacillus composti]MDT9724992.1 DUF309 domain-containing protein [Xylanibacillus composti]GIQ68233.1 hypothetical protein XYCOK13_10570 [Xylanibacillus composti]
MSSYDKLYVAFLRYFNVERDYFECHEVMEELWLEEGRKPFYQGLLQVAVGLYHFENGNISGSIKLFEAGIDKLRGSVEEQAGIDIGAILDDSQHYVEKLRRYEEAPFAFYDLNIRITDPVLEQAVQELEL